MTCLSQRVTSISNDWRHSALALPLLKVVWITECLKLIAATDFHRDGYFSLSGFLTMFLLLRCSSEGSQNRAGASVMAGAHNQNQWRQPVRRGPVHLLALHYACQDHQGLPHRPGWVWSTVRWRILHVLDKVVGGKKVIILCAHDTRCWFKEGVCILTDLDSTRSVPYYGESQQIIINSIIDVISISGAPYIYAEFGS